MDETPKRNWRRTVIGGKIVNDDWVMLDAAGQALARIYRIVGGPKDGRWAWFIQVDPDGRPYNGGSGDGANGTEAREAIEARIPSGMRVRW